MHLEEFKRRNYYLIVNQFESNIPDYKEGLDNVITKKLKFDKNTKLCLVTFINYGKSLL